MGLEPFLVAFSFSAGAASFFSPCSIGLFPAYVGYFLGLRDPEGSRGRDGPGAPILRGAGVGLVASLGFFLVFLGVGSVTAAASTALLGASLKWISVGVGLFLVVLGVVLLTVRLRGLALPRGWVPRERTPLAFLVFGVAYALASLGCTLPIFLGVVAGSLAAGGAGGALLVLVAYGLGMATVMVAASAALAHSEDTVRSLIRRAAPLIHLVGASLLVAGGGVLLFFYLVIWR